MRPSFTHQKGTAMKNKLKKALTTTKNHVARNKVTYAVGAVAVGAIALQQRNLREFYAFLEEKGIDPLEFYCPEAYEELKK